MKAFRRFRALALEPTQIDVQRGYALTFHCRLACETTHPRFRFLASPACTVVLTVNTGYE